MLTNTDRNVEYGKGGVLSQRDKNIIPKISDQLFTLREQIESPPSNSTCKNLPQRGCQLNDCHSGKWEPPPAVPAEGWLGRSWGPHRCRVP